MLLKVIPTTATALELVEDTNIAKIDLQLVIVVQLQEVINQIIVNRTSLKNRLNKIGIIKVKMPSVKRFKREKSKLKGFFYLNKAKNQA